MKKQIVWQDGNANKENRRKWEKEKADVQKVVDLYNAVGLPQLNDGNALHRMVNDTANFMYDMLCGGEAAHLTIGTGDNRTHLPIDKSKAIDMLQKPAGYAELIAGINELVRTAKEGTPSNGDITWRISNIAKYFVVKDGITVDFTPEKEAEIAEVGNKYVTSEAAKKVHSFIDGTIKQFQDNGIEKLCASMHHMGTSVTPLQKMVLMLQSMVGGFNGNTWEPKGQLYAFDERMTEAEKGTTN